MRSHIPQILFILLVAGGCARTDSASSNSGNQAPADVGRSFAVAPTGAPADLRVDQTRISIRKSALEKEFLLNGSLITQESAPEFHALQSRIVFFRRQDAKVVMIEASRGQLLTRDYPQTLPLAEYAVTGETDDLISFDFNAGMNRLLLGTDFISRESNPGPGGYVAVKSSFSYLSRAAILGDQLLEVHQTALVELPVRSLMVNVPIEVIYYLRPYRVNPDFKPTVAPPDHDHLGFVESPTQYNDESGSKTFAAKRDITKPIVYTISANTPARFRGAIRDGALYWNKAFGRPVIQVVEAANEGDVPDPLRNVIRWVDFESAGFAYADLQYDPRTGEILHQQIYLTSAWARVAREDLRTHHQPSAGSAWLKRLGVIDQCSLEVNETVARELADLRPGLSSPERIDKATNDILRAVVAHEVGHTLGLLHNFAGTHAANYELDAREELLQKYLAAGAAPAGVVVTSSVMDYTRPVESMIFGDQILRSPRAAEYDEKAIQALYFDRQFKSSELPLFCTDAQVGTYADCAVHVAGKSLIAWIKYEGRRSIETLPRQILDGFIEAKVPLFGETSAGIEGYRPNVKRIAKRMFRAHAGLVKLLRGETKLLAVERSFPNRGSAFKKEIATRTQEALAIDLAREGGLDKVLLKASPKLAPLMANEFERLLSLPETIRGRTIEDKPYEFTSAEIGAIKEIGAHLFESLSLEMARVEIGALGGKVIADDDEESPEQQLLALIKGPPKRFDLTPVTRDFATYLVRRAAFFIFATRGEPLEFKRQFAWSSPNATVDGAVGDETNLRLPRFAYPFDLRLKTADLLRPDRARSPAWGHNERRVLGALYAKMYGEAAPGVDAAAPDALDGWPPEALRWMLEARELGTLLELSSQRLPRAEIGKGAPGL